MRTSTRIAAIGAATLGVAGVLAAPAVAAPAHSHSEAVFVETDNLHANTVIAYARHADGTLHRAGSYRTGGVGGQLTGSVVDHTASQGALTLDPANHLLYAVNAGSNTVTVFSVHGTALHRVQVVASGGSFPVSVTAWGNDVYVLNARGGGSIQGFRRTGDHLTKVAAWHRELGFDPAMTPEFTSTPGQIAFTPDGSKLVVTTKGDSSSFDVFAVGAQGKPAAKPVVTADPENVPFAVSFDKAGDVVAAEAGPNNVATFRLAANGTLHLIARHGTGQMATCWVTVVGRNVYAANAASATISRFTLGPKGGLIAEGTKKTDPGAVDVAASSDGHFLYEQTGAKGIVDEFRIGPNGGLTALGSVTVPGAVGGEGIVAS